MWQVAGDRPGKSPPVGGYEKDRAPDTPFLYRPQAALATEGGRKVCRARSLL